MQHSENLKTQSIVIVGGGTAGWMTASLMMNAWGKDTNFTLIESEDIATVGVGEGSTPSLRSFFRQLGIPESEWMPECNATYKCGISFPNWSTIVNHERYFHPFFSHLDLPTGNAFMQNACIRRRGGDSPAAPDSFWVSAQLAKQNKSPIPIEPLKAEPDYGYHFDSGLLGQFLKRRALKLGITHLFDTVNKVNQESTTKDIQSVTTAENGTISADLFIDCTGFLSLLIEKTLNVPFVSYKEALYNDRAVAIASNIDNELPIPSHTESTALSAGWAWKIPLVSRYGNGYVYSSDYISDADAETELRAHIGPSCEGMKARFIKMRVGRRELHWHKNVLAVGLSQGFIEPLEATALMLIQFTIDRFIHFYNERNKNGLSLEELQEKFNDKVNCNFDGIKDYIVAHYRLNTRKDTKYWIDNSQNKDLSQRLVSILNSWDNGLDFEATLASYTGELSYTRPSWYCLLAGMGRFPELIHTDYKDSQSTPLTVIRQRIEEVTPLFPDHREHLIKTYGNKWPKTSS